jgi:hypothetical protein
LVPPVATTPVGAALGVAFASLEPALSPAVLMEETT